MRLGDYTCTYDGGDPDEVISDEQYDTLGCPPESADGYNPLIAVSPDRPVPEPEDYPNEDTYHKAVEEFGRIYSLGASVWEHVRPYVIQAGGVPTIQMPIPTELPPGYGEPSQFNTGMLLAGAAVLLLAMKKGKRK